MAAGLGEREIAEFIEDDDVEASEIVGDASLASGSTFGLELTFSPAEGKTACQVVFTRLYDFTKC